MARILSFNPINKSFVKRYWSLFKSLDSFTKLFVVSYLLIGLVTPIIVANLQISTQQAVGQSTTIGVLKLAATYESISVEANFSGDDGNNSAILEYRKVGDAGWKQGLAMVMDRRTTVRSDNNTITNPYVNQARASILGVQPDTDYEVRVTFNDPDLVTGVNPVVSTIKTRDENPPSTGRTVNVSTQAQFTSALSGAQPGDNIIVAPGTYSPITISSSGNAGNWITIKASNYANKPQIRGTTSQTLVNITGSYVIFSGFDIGTGVDGISIHANGSPPNTGPPCAADNRPPNEYIIVEKNFLHDIRANSEEDKMIIIGDSFTCQNRTANITIQDNDLRQDQGTDEPQIVVAASSASGGHVIRRNNISFTYPVMMGFHGTDCFGGVLNFEQRGPWGGWTKDTDIYDNVCDSPTDDGIEDDGANVNVRIWGNTIKAPMNGISISPVSVGPSYIFKNIVVDNRPRWEPSCTSIKDGSPANGWVFFYSNTIYTLGGSCSFGGPIGQADYGGSGSQGNVTWYNNILHTGGRVWQTGGITLDYNLYFQSANADKWAEWNGQNIFGFAAFKTASGQDSHSINAKATFVNEAGRDLHLATGSQGIDKGLVITGFNDPNGPFPFVGNAPDMGAFESGFAGPTSTPVPTGGPTVTPQPTAIPTPQPTLPPGVTPTPLLTPVPGSTANVGITTIGGSNDSGDSNAMNGTLITAGPGSVDLVTMSVYVGTITAAPNNQFELGIYTDSAGNPGTLVARSTRGTLSANSWNTVPVAASLTAGTSYWLMYNTNGTSSGVNNLKYATGGQSGYRSPQTFGSWPVTFGTAKKESVRFSIYASYIVPTTTPTGGEPTNTPVPTEVSTPAPTVVPTPIPTVITPTDTPIPTFSITGNVYSDTNQNGAKDAGETNYQGATITLSGDATATEVTGTNGTYTLSGLSSGSYSVIITAPTNYIVTTTNPQAVALGPNATVNFGIVATPTPIPTNVVTPTPVSGSLILGYNVIGTSVDSGDSNSLNGSQFTMGSTNAAVTSMSVFVAGIDTNAANKNYQMAIYSDIAGKPGNLIARSNSGILVANAWNTLPFSATLNANTTYWLVYNTNGRSGSVNEMRYSNVNVSKVAYTNSDVMFGTWPASFGSSTVVANLAFSIYATYTPF